MQRIMEYGKRSFWTSRLDTVRLNEKIQELEKDGWKVVSVCPNANFFGIVASYTLLIEKED